MNRYAIINAIENELDRAYKKHGAPQWGRHEFYAILKEEVDELWSDIKADKPQENVVKEAIQVAAMVVRYLETNDRYREPVPTYVDPSLRAAFPKDLPDRSPLLTGQSTKPSPEIDSAAHTKYPRE